MRDNFLNFKKISETETEMYVYGDIRKKSMIEKWLNIQSDATDAFALKDAINAVDTPNLIVRINSYGGSVSEGLAIYSLLSDFKGHLKTIVDGFACSAASVIFMAGKERVVPENGLLMIHNAWTEARGDSNTMKKVAEDLEKITQPSLNIYTSKTNLSEEEIKEKMDREEWITSKEAYEWGFSTAQEKNETQQALEADFVFNLVMKNKGLQKELEEFKEKQTEDNIQLKVEEIVQKGLKQYADELKQEMKKMEQELIYGSGDKESVGLFNSVQNKKDAWTSFFNTKK